MKTWRIVHQSWQLAWCFTTIWLIAIGDACWRMNHRLKTIEELRWEVGLMVPQEKLDRMHDSEKQYFHEYNKILDKYMKSYVPKCKEPLDLIADAQAPEELNINVRVLDEGYGELVTQDSGVVRLRRGYQVMVKQTDVEMLIRAGKVEHVKSVRS